MIKRGIKIEGDNNNFLSVSLKDILSCIKSGHNNKWSIIHITNAYWNADENGSILTLEKEINDSKDGLFVSWHELKTLSNKIKQVSEILIIGDKDVTNLKSYANDDKMFENCDCVIELVDSSYWIVYANLDDIEAIRSNLKGLKDLPT